MVDARWAAQLRVFRLSCAPLALPSRLPSLETSGDALDLTSRAALLPLSASRAPQDSPELNLDSGTVIAGRYTVSAMIGKGSFSRVVQCLDLQAREAESQKVEQRRAYPATSYQLRAASF